MDLLISRRPQHPALRGVLQHAEEYVRCCSGNVGVVIVLCARVGIRRGGCGSSTPMVSGKNMGDGERGNL